MIEPTGPFGDEIRLGSSTAGDWRGSVEVGRLYPFPIYVVLVKTMAGKHGRVLFGAKAAIRYANMEWRTWFSVKMEAPE